MTTTMQRICDKLANMKPDEVAVIHGKELEKIPTIIQDGVTLKPLARIFRNIRDAAYKFECEYDPYMDEVTVTRRENTGKLVLNVPLVPAAETTRDETKVADA